MDKGTKVQLIQMQSLMERMEKHYTKDVVFFYIDLNTQKIKLSDMKKPYFNSIIIGLLI